MGTGVGVCGCGERGTVTLEKYDLTNHADHWNNSNNVCDGCGSVVNNESINISRYNYNYVEFVMDGTQSFEIDVILNTKHNSSSTAWYHSFVGEVFTPGWSEGGWSYRSDWYGNQQFPNAVAKYTDINNGLWGGKYFEASADMDVIINFKFDAETGTFTVTMTYSSNIEPYCNEDKHPIYTLSNVSYRGELHVAFGTENSHTTYQYAKIVEGSGTLLDFDYHNKYLDGNMDEEIWTEEVKTNKFEFNKPDGEVLMDIYATRAEDGIYVFVDYKVLELHTSGDWWQQDNLEWRLLTTSGRLYHRFNNNQFYVSTSGNYTSTDFYKSVAVKNGDYFEICFEAFVSYAELGVSADEALAISFAANPGGNGFYAMQPWDTDDFSSALLVTTEGLKQQ